MSSKVPLPLRGIYVLDFVPGPMAAIGRQLTELGADVVRVEPPGGGRDRLAGDDLPAWLDFAVLNLGKRATRVDPDDHRDRQRLESLLQRADVILLDASLEAHFALDPEDLRKQLPQSVLVSVSNYGIGTRLSNWRLTEPVLHALTGSLSRSGVDGMPPLLPPLGVAEGCAAAQGLWVTLSALYKALQTGRGDHLDFAVLDGAMQAFDPGFGVGGCAALQDRFDDLPPGRPQRGFWYPILECADGRVRLCVLAPRQWDRLFEWMGKPEAFADERYRDLYVRLAAPALWDCVANFFADKTLDELEQEGERRGVPVIRLLSLSEVVDHPHLQARGAIASLSLPGGASAASVRPPILIDGMHTASRGGVPELGEDDGAPLEPAAARPRPGTASPASRRPFAGLRVLDLGVIVAGAEAGRLFADLGADVVKVESGQSPDATRRPTSGLRMVPSFAAGNRNKRGLGLNLRDRRGRDYFLQLAAQADVILSNFKPGTLENMGLSHAEIAAVNPRIVTAESSAFGASGPLSGRMGYGPLLRALSGLTHGWRYPGKEALYADQEAVYPDHVAGRYVASAAVALLIRQLLGGPGGSVSVAQLDVILSHLNASIARSSLDLPVSGVALPWGVYPTGGQDNWLVISVRNDSDWRALVEVMEQPELADDPRFDQLAARRANSEALDNKVSEWSQHQDGEQAMSALQSAGVPAAVMLRITELPGWPHHCERRFFRTESHPLLAYPQVMENAPVLADGIPAPGLRPAPERGEHTREVLLEWLQLNEDAIQEMLAAGVFEQA